MMMMNFIPPYTRFLWCLGAVSWGDGSTVSWRDLVAVAGGPTPCLGADTHNLELFHELHFNKILPLPLVQHPEPFFVDREAPAGVGGQKLDCWAEHTVNQLNVLFFCFPFFARFLM